MLCSCIHKCRSLSVQCRACWAKDASSCGSLTGRSRGRPSGRRGWGISAFFCRFGRGRRIISWFWRCPSVSSPSLLLSCPLHRRWVTQRLPKLLGIGELLGSRHGEIGSIIGINNIFSFIAPLRFLGFFFHLKSLDLDHFFGDYSFETAFDGFPIFIADEGDLFLFDFVVVYYHPFGFSTLRLYKFEPSCSLEGKLHGWFLLTYLQL